jgi:uncharacterized protein
MSNNHIKKNQPISAEQVADYLGRHRNFFIDNPSLLADMHFIHETGDAISLVERQVALLRERNIDTRQRMGTLLDNARDNDKLFSKTKRLILNLLDAEDAGGIVDVLLHSFRNEFGIQYTSLLVYGESPQTLIANGARIVPLNDVKKHLHMLIDNRQAFCGQLSTVELKLIFDDSASFVNSTAVVPIHHGSPLGLLAIGHQDAKHFHSGTNTLFLSYIGDVLARLLPQKMVI